MMGCEAAAGQALVCYQCVCITWWSVLGLCVPLIAALVYLPRVVNEATIDDWLILGFATLMTFASRRVQPEGVAHEPWLLYIVCLWGMLACTTDRSASLRSIPLIGFMVFVSVLVPDIFSSIYERPAGAVGIPGGRGPVDGLVLKPLMAIGVTTLAYWLKVRPILPNKDRRGKAYDAASRAFLLNVSPWYRRPTTFEAKLNLVPQAG